MSQALNTTAIAGLVLLLLVPTAESAQSLSTAQLQQIGQQDAAQYGVPWAVFQNQIQGESGWNPNPGVSSAGAEGIAQFMPGTAAQFGIDPNNPTQALAAAAQYDAELHQQTGSWTGALTSYTGGLTPSSPGNPAYAAAFAEAQAADGGDATTAATTPSTAPAAAPAATGGATVPTAAGTSLPAATTGSILDRPFSWAYQQFVAVIVSQVGTTLGQTEQMAAEPLSAALVLLVIVLGVLTVIGRMSMSEFFSRIIRIAFVVALLAPSSIYFQGWVVTAVQGLPGWFGQYFTGGATAGVSGSTSPVQILDSVYAASWADIIAIWHATSWVKALLVGVFLLVCGLIVGLSLLAIFLAVATLTFLTSIVLCLAPFAILALLFRETERFFRGYVDILVTLLLSVLAIDIVVSFFSTLMQGLMSAFTPSGSPDTDLPGFFGYSLVLLIMGLSVGLIPRMLEGIGHGVAVSFDGIGRAMHAGPVRDVALAPARFAGRWLGGI